VETTNRSAIPQQLDGTITQIEVLAEKRPGVDDVYMVWLDQRRIHLDPELAKQLREGDPISKTRWAKQLQTPRGTVSLKLSRDFWGMVWTLPLIGWVGLWLFRRKDSIASAATNNEPATTTSASSTGSFRA